MKHKITVKRILKWVGIATLTMAFFAFYWFYLSRTKIAFVNFQPVSLQSFAIANNNPMVKLYDLKVEDLKDIDDYDVVLITGMGLHITAEQRQIIQDAANNGLPIYTMMATDPANNIGNFNADEMALMTQWIMNGTRKNNRSLLNYLRRNIDGKLLFPGKVELPEQRQSDYLYFPSDDEEKDDKEFTNVTDYENFLRQQGLYHEGAKKIVVTGLVSDPRDLILRLYKEPYNVYPVYSMLHLLDYMEEIKPDAVINLAHGRLGDHVVDFLKSNNTLLFDPLYVNVETDEWEKNPMGMYGGFMSQSIVMPEIDGAIRTSALFALTKGKDGLLIPYAVPERLDGFVQTVKNYLSLRDKDNSKKRLAIVYFKGPGQSSLIASGMEVIPSLYNLLNRLKNEGYNLNGLPTTEKEFRAQIQKEGSLFNAFAKGDAERFLHAGHPQFVTKDAYEKWCDLSLPKNKTQEVTEQFGAFPGDHNQLKKDGKLAFPRLTFGNVVLIPQPLAGEGDDVFKITHGTGIVPPHSYIAPYLWAQHAFKADALIHFGTHGSLEYTPQKQVALSNSDWPDRLVGALPHFYIYTIDNVGEAMIARRRTYAGLQSYLTPPFHESDVRHVYKQLEENVTAYLESKDANKQTLAREIKRLTVQLGLHNDLGLDSVMTRLYSDADIERIANYQEELAAEKICDTPYIMGLSYNEADVKSSIYSMTTDPLAYSLFALDRIQRKVKSDLNQHKFQFDRQYRLRAERLVTQWYNNTDSISAEQLAAITGLPDSLINKARALTAERNAPKGMMAMMMNAARKDSKSSEHTKTMTTTLEIPAPKMNPIAKIMSHQMRKMMAKKDPSRMIEMARKMGAPEEALKKMEAALKKQMGTTIGNKQTKDEPTGPSKDEIELANAVNDVETSLRNIGTYKQYLEQSPSLEMASMVNALNGGFTAPTPGGDPIANPNVLPTGRNMFAINAEETPTEDAWNKGVELANATIAEYQKRHNGAYPRKVSYTLWSGEFITTKGATIAQALYMLGVEPIRDRYGRVNDLKLISSKDLGRPRIDVVVQTSGQLRDLAASRLFLINRAVTMAANANNDEFDNMVKLGVEESERFLIDKGVSPKQAREMSAYRVFGGANGGYGTGIQGMVEQGNAWDDRKQIAEVYSNNMGAFYGSEEEWMTDMSEAFNAALTRTDVVIQPRQSNTWGALSLDHVYEFMGGLNLAVEEVTGKDPDAYFSDYRNRNNYRVQDSKEAIGVEARTKLLNESYIRRAMKGGETPTNEIAEMVRNTYGWNVTKPKNIDKAMWDKIYNVYINDKFGLDIKEQFANVNPSAMQDLTATMLETARKGMWQASPEQLKQLANVHTEFVKRFGPNGSSFEGNNPKLQAFIAQHAPTGNARQYKQQMSNQTQTAQEKADKAQVLEKQTTQTEELGENTSFNGILVVSILLVLFVLSVIVIRRKWNTSSTH